MMFIFNILRITSFLIVLILIFSVHQYLKSTDGSLTSNPSIPALKKILHDRIESEEFSGVVLVAMNDKLILLQGYGEADIENQMKNAPSTQFLIGSLTEMFTAAAILKLVEEGKIALNEPISRYIPANAAAWGDQMPDWANQAAIHDLLTHRSGLNEFAQLPAFDKFYEQLHSSDELIQFFANYPLKFEPGKQFDYNRSGYHVLGLVIEKVANTPYAKFLHQQFFKPLEMSSTFAPHKQFLSSILPRYPKLADGYVLDDSDQTPSLAEDINLSTAFAERSIISNAMDLYRWTNALFHGEVISYPLLEKMLTSYSETDQKNVGMGYSFFIDNEDSFHPVYYHSGRISGYDSFLAYEPQRGIYLIILSNRMDGKAFELADPLYQLVSENLPMYSY